jgi:hypothetical protein
MAVAFGCFWLLVLVGLVAIRFTMCAYEQGTRVASSTYFIVSIRCEAKYSLKYNGVEVEL